MRETYSSLLQTTKDFCIDDSTNTLTTLSSSKSFLRKEINKAIKDIFFLCRKYSLQIMPKTAKTVAGQIWYHNPPGLSKIETVTIQVTNWTSPPLRIIQSQEEWDFLHQTPVAASNFPQAVFPRRDDFGIYPTPQLSDYTITLTGNYSPTNLGFADYTTGTVTVGQNSTLVTGSGTGINFTDSMIGKWFCLTDVSETDRYPTGNWYRISAVPTATTLTLESYFEETGVTGSSYVIGDSPDIPEEFHEYIPYRAASVYYATRRRDMEQSQRLLNFYYTGDYANPSRRGNVRSGILGVFTELQEKGRANSQLTETGGFHNNKNRFKYDVWSTVLSAP